MNLQPCSCGLECKRLLFGITQNSKPLYPFLNPIRCYEIIYNKKISYYKGIVLQKNLEFKPKSIY